LKRIISLISLLTLIIFAAPVLAANEAQPDLSKQKTMYLVGTAHLDTQWNWTIQQTITDFLPSTILGNFHRFSEFPSYDFSFEGAFRYMLIKEYYPDYYARVKEYVDSGRWHVAGSTIDAMDVNVPSPESLIRQVLYGNGFYKKEFGKTSCDIFLPDCFGFGYALPSIAAFCGLKGFSSQKLTWGAADGIPFDLGRWTGPDGSSIIAARVGTSAGRISRRTTSMAPSVEGGEPPSESSLRKTSRSQIGRASCRERVCKVV
jgi:alpha-mannosidase